MWNVALVDLIYLAAFVCVMARERLPKSPALPRLGLILMLYGVAGLVPKTWGWFLDEDGTLLYAADALILLGAVLIAPSSSLVRPLIGTAFLLLLAIVGSIWLEHLTWIRGGHRDLYRFGGMVRPGGWDYNPIPAGEDGVMLLGLSLGMLGAGRSWRPLAWLGIGLSASSVVLTMSRGALLGAVFVIAIGGVSAHYGQGKDRWRGVGLAGLTLLAAFALAPQSAVRLAGTPSDSSARVRLTSWAATPGIIWEHPMGGVHARSDILTRLDGYGALSLPGQFGLVGGIPLVFLAGGIVWIAVLHAGQSVRIPTEGKNLGVALAVVGVVAAEAFSEPFPDLLHTPFVWLVIGLTAANPAVPAGIPLAVEPNGKAPETTYP